MRNSNSDFHKLLNFMKMYGVDTHTIRFCKQKKFARNRQQMYDVKYSSIEFQGPGSYLANQVAQAFKDPGVTSELSNTLNNVIGSVTSNADNQSKMGTFMANAMRESVEINREYFKSTVSDIMCGSITEAIARVKQQFLSKIGNIGFIQGITSGLEFIMKIVQFVTAFVTRNVLALGTIIGDAVYRLIGHPRVSLQDDSASVYYDATEDGITFQGFDEENTISLIDMFIGTIRSTFTGLPGALFKLLDIIKKMLIGFDSVSKAAEILEAIFNRILTWLSDFTVRHGICHDRWWISVQSEYRLLRLEYYRISRIVGVLAKIQQGETQMITEVIHLKNGLDGIIDKIGTKKTGQLVELQNINRTVSEWIRAIPSSFNQEIVPRIVPMWINLYGPPGVGKTDFFKTAIGKSIHKYLTCKKMIASNYEDYSKAVYPLNIAEPYWDNFGGQPIIMSTDLGQNKDIQNDNKSLIDTITQLIQNDAWKPPVADLTKKGSIEPRPYAWLTDSQSSIPSSEILSKMTLSQGSHLCRRLTCEIEVKFNTGASMQTTEEDRWYIVVREPTIVVGSNKCDTKYALPEKGREFTKLSRFAAWLQNKIRSYYEGRAIISNKVNTEVDKFVSMMEFQGPSQFVTFSEMVKQYSTGTFTKVMEMYYGTKERFLHTIHDFNKYIREFFPHETIEEYELPDIGEDVLPPFLHTKSWFELQRTMFYERFSSFAESFNDTVKEKLIRLVPMYELLKGKNFHYILGSLTLVVTLLAGGYNIYKYSRGKEIMEQSKPNEGENIRKNVRPRANAHLQSRPNEGENAKKFIRPRPNSNIGVQSKPNEGENIKGNVRPRPNVKIDVQSKPNEGENMHKNVRPRENIKLKVQSGDENKDVEPQSNEIYAQNMSILDAFSNSISGNIYKIAMKQNMLSDGGMAWALQIRGRVFMCNKHICNSQSEGDKIYLVRASSIWAGKPAVNEYDRRECIIKEIPDYDLTFIQVPYCSNATDITKMFIPKGAFPNSCGAHILYQQRRGYVSTSENSRYSYQAFTNLGDQVCDTIRSTAFGDVRCTLRLAKVKEPTIAGDCGSIYIMDTGKNNIKIIGIHSGGNKAYRVAITTIDSDDLECVLDKFPKDPINIGSPFKAQSEEARLYDLKLNVTGKLYLDGVDKPQPMCANKTSFVETPLREILSECGYSTPHVRKPVHLRPFNSENGDRVYPAHLALSKLTNTTTAPTKVSHKIITSYMIRYYSQFDSMYKREYRRVLTMEEAVRGIPGVFDSMKLNTSAGFPWVKETTKGKHAWIEFDNDKVIIDPKLVQRVEYVLELIRQGKYEQIVVIDTLKDEVLIEEKVNAGKVRIFQVLPMEINIVGRMLFLSFYEHLKVNAIDCPVSIGIDNISYQWTRLVKRLARVNPDLEGDKQACLIVGDYKNYDSTLHSCVGDNHAHIANSFYNDEYSLARITLMDALFNCAHAFDGEIFENGQGNPSGQFGTTPVNSTGNHYYYLQSYGAHFGLNVFNDGDYMNPGRHIELATMGDDNICCVSKEAIKQGFNATVLERHLKNYGMTYTSPEKTGAPQPLVVLSEASFLKRQFIYNSQIRAYLSPLDLGTASNIGFYGNKNNIASEEFYNNVLNDMYTELCIVKVSGLDKDGLCDKLRQAIPLVRNVFKNNNVCFGESCVAYHKHLPSCKGQCGIELDDYSHIIGRSCSSLTPIEIDASLGYETPEEVVSRLFSIDAKGVTDAEIIFQGREDSSSHNTCRDSQPTADQSLSKMAMSSEKTLAANNNNNKTNNDVDSVTTTSFSTIQEGTTQFADQRESAIQAIHPTSSVSQMTNVPDVDLDIFFTTPRLIRTIKWTDSQAPGTLLTRIVLPQNYLQSPIVSDKIKNLQFWRPDMEVTFKVNSTVMHYGRLLIAWVPQANKLPLGYQHFENATGLPWVQISASQLTPVTIPLPYSHYKDIMTTKDVVDDLYTLYVYVAVPLTSMNPTTAPVELTIFTKCTNPNFMGYSLDTYTTSGDVLEAQSSEGEIKSKEGLSFSSVVSGIGSIAEPLSALPAIGPIASGISAVANVVGPIAKALGFASPPNLAATQSFQIRQPQFQRIEDLPNSIALGNNADSEICQDYAYVNDVVDCTDILRYAQRPFLIDTIRISDTDQSDKLLAAYPISPVALVHNSYFSPYDPTSYYPSPLAFTARLALFWRGSIRYHFSIIASKFHSLRLVLSYVPYTSGTFPATIPDVVSSQLVKKVIDINEETEFTIEIPYLQPNPWARHLKTPNDTIYNQSTNGCLYLSVLNSLTSGSSPVSPIYVQVFASAGDDYAMACPSTANCSNLGWDAALSRNQTLTLAPSDDVFEAQSGAPAPSLSESGLRSAVSSPFVTGSKLTMLPQGSFHASQLRTFKQVTNMLSPIANLNLVQGSPAQIYTVVYRSLDATSKYNFMANAFMVFRYMRGGIRVAFINSQNERAVAYARVLSAGDNMPPVDPETCQLADYPYIAQNSTIFPNPLFTPVDLIIPWYSNYQNTLLSQLSGAPADQFLNQGTVVLYPSVSGKQNVWMCGHDDMALGWALPPPQMKISA